jgi:hypothetical protein
VTFRRRADTGVTFDQKEGTYASFAHCHVRILFFPLSWFVEEWYLEELSNPCKRGNTDVKTMMIK